MKVNCLKIAVYVLLCVASFICGSRCDDDQNDSLPAIVSIDTVYRAVPAEPVVITKIKTKIVRTSDTIIRFQPFIAMVDTVIKHDTINASFEYPANLFSLTVRSHPDTLMTERILYSANKSGSEEWWIKPLIFAGGLIGGYFIGLIK